MHTITGILHVKKEIQKVTDSFQKREFVIKIEDSEYPQYVSLQLKQDKCPILDRYEEGTKLVVTFNINGRKWTKDGETKYFNSLDAWKLEAVGTTGEATQRNYEAVPQEKDDLPF